MKIIILTVLVTISAVLAGELPCNCRLGNLNRIVKGQVAAAHSIPWMVSLSGAFGNHFCGGSILNEKFVLTAAHCVLRHSAQDIVVRTGLHDTNDFDFKKYNFVENIIKGEFTQIGDAGDFALLELKKPLRFIPGEVEPACLNLIDTDFKEDLLAAGWGLTERTWRNENDRSGELNSSPTDVTELKYFFGTQISCSYNDICMVAKNKGDSGCQGDSGGPLMHTLNGKTSVIGVASYSPGITENEKTYFCNGFDAYARLSLYKDIFDQHVQNYCTA